MIQIRNLNQRFKNEWLYQDFNLSFARGEITCIIGSSGCGKTTLLRMIAGLEPFESGTIEGVKRDRLSYVFQEDRLLPWLSVWDNIDLVLRDKAVLPIEREKTVNEILQLLKLDSCKGMFPGELSGGMQRRVALGRALSFDLACGGELMLLDEPFKGLDAKLKEEITAGCYELWKRDKKTVLLVTHDLEEARLLGDCIYEFFGRPVQVELLKQGSESKDDRID